MKLGSEYQAAQAAATPGAKHGHTVRPASGRSSRNLLSGIQGLRALAALAVAFHHIAHDAITNGGDPAGYLTQISAFMPWEAGVDIFFVISGFVIVHASAALFAQPGGAMKFLKSRLTRIVPLYWIMTTAFLAIALAGGGVAVHGDLGGPAYLAASYLFIPWARPDGIVQPALGLGWTLNYEMFFYAVFAVFLRLKRERAVIAAASLFCAFVAYGQIIGFANLQAASWSNPIILEFAAGMGIALCRAKNVRLPGAARLALFLLGLAALHFGVTAPVAARALVYGIPAAALVAAAALTPASAIITTRQNLLIRLGDASYAMYLVHPFVMRGFTLLWHKIHAANELTGTIYVLTGLLAAQACALAINVTVERKLKKLLRRRDGKLKDEAV
jgi:peptidoglycan/LPS O-acetylase OafA/YrhL